MATGAFKTYERQHRQFLTEDDFAMGMYFTDGIVEPKYMKTLVNFNIVDDGKKLIPREGIRVKQVLVPDLANDGALTYHSEAMNIQDAKKCKENGELFQQIITGRPAAAPIANQLWVSTSPECTYDELGAAVSTTASVSSTCTFLQPNRAEIHGITLKDTMPLASAVGCFGFGNGYYFLDETSKKLKKTVFDPDTKTYSFAEITPKSPTVSEAVTYGYNMLKPDIAEVLDPPSPADDPYTFACGTDSTNLIIDGVLLYELDDSDLVMSPRQGEHYQLKTYYNLALANTKSYLLIWEWRESTSSDWSEFHHATLEPLGEGEEVYEPLVCENFSPPVKNTMVRVSAYEVYDIADGGMEGIDFFTYNTEDVVDTYWTYVASHSMTIGFNFLGETEKVNKSLDPIVYDLTTAKGMCYWKNRLAIYGVPQDPTILFMSDLNEPTYFPYPNNTVMFDDPIIDARLFMDSLIVFTEKGLYKITLNTDGTSWTTTTLQTNLHITPWDRHLIQVVKNMVFFKSGNYYYMVVPKASSTTGELTLAPVSTPMTEFFDGFSHNIRSILEELYEYVGDLELVHYYNFLDYEDIHNIYVFEYEVSSGVFQYMHFDMQYSTIERSWRIHIYDFPNVLHPYTHDSTQKGQLISTGLNTKLRTHDYTEVAFPTASANITEPTTVKLACLGKFKLPEGVLIFKLDGVSKDVFNINRYGNATGSSLGYNLVYFDGYSYIQAVGANTIPVGAFYTFIGSNSTEAFRAGYFRYPTQGKIKIYEFVSPHGLTTGSILSINGELFYLEQEVDGFSRWNDKYGDLVHATAIDATHLQLEYSFAYQDPELKLYNDSMGTEATGRLIQIYGFDTENVQDVFIPSNVPVPCGETISDVSMNLGDITKTFSEDFTDYSRFVNYQYFDTGYRNYTMEAKKRYRELQFWLNNVDSIDLNIGAEFLLDGDIRRGLANYVIDQITEEGADYGQLYIRPEMNNIEQLPNLDNTLLDTWKLDLSTFPTTTLWKLRLPISGKGYTPRFKFKSVTIARYEFLSYTWVFRLMYLR